MKALLVPCQAFQALINLLGLAPLGWGCWGFVLPESTCPTFKRTLWNVLIFPGAAEAVARIRTGTCSCLKLEQFLSAFILEKKKKVFKIFRIFLTVFLMLDLFGFIFFLSVGLWGALSQRGMMLLIQISFIMEVKSLLHIPGC